MYFLGANRVQSAVYLFLLYRVLFTVLLLVDVECIDLKRDLINSNYLARQSQELNKLNSTS